MWRYLVGSLAALALVAAGMLIWNRSSRSVAALPLASQTAPAAGDSAGLSDSVPEASDKTREQKRFDRYDKDRNSSVTREEYLASRRKAFAKLDVNHDGQLSFDEWAAKTEAKFAAADADKSGAMTATEFAATAPKRRVAHVKRDCAKEPPAPASEDS